jgi:uroporphyrinogen III methyltransferase/synthase
MIVRGIRPIVALTRDHDGNDRVARTFRQLGARTLSIPTIRIVAPDDPRPLHEALSVLDSFHWVVFTSANAANAILDQRERFSHTRDGRACVRIASVGRRTAARLMELEIASDVVAARSETSSLVQSMCEYEAKAPGPARALENGALPLTGRRVLWPRSEIAPPDLERLLTEAGAVVTAPVAYRTIGVRPAAMNRFRDLMACDRIAAVAFCSPSSVRSLAATLPGGRLDLLNGRTIVAAIGPRTSAAVTSLGGRVDLEPDERSADALAHAIMGRLSAQTLVS